MWQPPKPMSKISNKCLSFMHPPGFRTNVLNFGKYVFYKVLSIKFYRYTFTDLNPYSVRLYRYIYTDIFLLIPNSKFIQYGSIDISIPIWKIPWIKYNFIDKNILLSFRQFAQKQPQNSPIFLHGITWIYLAIWGHYGIIDSEGGVSPFPLGGIWVVGCWQLTTSEKLLTADGHSASMVDIAKIPKKYHFWGCGYYTLFCK